MKGRVFAVFLHLPLVTDFCYQHRFTRAEMIIITVIHLQTLWSVLPSFQTLLGESNIYKMTTSNDLSSTASWCAQLTFFFSTAAELQLSARWLNAIEAPYGRGNVISPALILCLQPDREEIWRDGIWIGAAIEQGMEDENVFDGDSGK